jgi:hypothetical protein
MSDPTIAFLRQPFELLARGSEEVAGRVILTLNDWVKSDRTAHVVKQAHRMFVLAAPATTLNVLVIWREGRRHATSIDVCAVDVAEAARLMAHFEPLGDLDHFAPMVTVKLQKLHPMLLRRAAETIDPAIFKTAHHGWDAIYHWARQTDLKASNAPWNTARLLDVVETSSDRWASSRARNQFKTLMDDARERPQVVERDGDDLLVVSMRYLKEAVEPTSARDLSRRYLAMALSDADMSVLNHGALPPLENLPEIGTA